MKEYQSLAHTRWDCKYHVVFIPKMRKKKIFGVLRQHLGAIFRELAKHKEVEVVEGHLMSDHVHICLSMPPTYAVSNVVDYNKGKSAITIVRKSIKGFYWRGILGKRLLAVLGGSRFYQPL